MTHQVISCFTPPDREEFTALLKDYYDLVVARVREDGGTVGDAFSAIEEFWEEVDKYMPPEGRLFIAKNDARGTGLGRHLIERRIDAARNMGIKTLLVDTLKANVEMQGLYHKLGFEEIDVYQESATYNMLPELLPMLVFFRMELE